MNENETKQPEKEPRVDTVEDSTVSTTESPSASPASTKQSSYKGYVAAVVIVALVILGVLYLLEKEGRSSTSIFSSAIENQDGSSLVAVVNGEEIISSDLDTSIQQFEQAAQAQGLDINSTTTQAEIQEQALQVLVNTTLLKQEAAEQEIAVDDEAVAERIAIVQSDIGGEEALAERMATLGISEERLQKDIRDELLIQQLLDEVFADADITVTEEEIAAVYASAGGEEAGLPALEEVRPQVEAQIIASKEQEAIDAYLAELREVAQIEIVSQ